MSFTRKLATLSISRSFGLIAALAVLIAVGAVGYTLNAARNEMITLKRAEIRMRSKLPRRRSRATWRASRPAS